MTIKHLSIILLIAITSLVASYGIFILYAVWPISLGNLDKAGVFGDSFGVLTALFSGLAFAGIILTILLQREELVLQREELRLTRGELSAQNETAKLQTFENTFFQILRVHDQILNSIDLSRNVKNAYADVTTGRDCFNAFYNRLRAYYRRIDMSEQHKSEQEKIAEAYSGFWTEHGQELAHYFRYLYTMYQFVEARAPDKRFYSKVIRAQLSNQELLVLFYNCLFDHGREKFKPLIEKYAVFNNLPIDQLLSPTHKELYESGAFDWMGGAEH